MTRRVLIIDDDEDHAESIADILELRGYEVEVAYSGEEGADTFRQSDFDMILLDVKLPGMNGLETLFEFKKIRPGARIIMMTGYSVEQLLAQAVENGALGVLRKPFQVEELLDVLERVKPRGMILVADDDPDFAASIESLLRQHGYAVEIARTGEKALEILSAGAVNCLVLDLHMPVLSGVEVYMRLKETGQLVPTILVTGFADEQRDAISQLTPLTSGLLIKPFNPADLVSAIEATAGVEA